MPLQYKASDGQPSRTHPARSLQGQGTPGVEYVGVHGGVSSLGYFWSYVEIGTPAQTFSVILDTGSSLTAVPCAGCDQCGTHMDPKYDPSASSTSRFISCPSDDCHGTCSHNMCRYHQGYSEGSTLEGYYVTDKFWVGLEGEAYAVDFVFGCHDLETLLFKTQLADGIMGLGARDNTIVSVLQEAHNLPEFVFALCLGRHGGSFSVGGYNESLHTGPIVYTPLDPDDTMYSVSLRDIMFDGVSLGVGDVYGYTIVDSGTTFTYLPSTAYSRLMTRLEEACANEACGPRERLYSDEPPCFVLGEVDPDYAAFPLMKLALQDMQLVVSARGYLFQDLDYPDHYCIGVFSNGARDSVIGADVMRGYDVIFDRERSRVGWAPARCSEADGVCVACDAVSLLAALTPLTYTTLFVAAVFIAVVLVVAVREWRARSRSKDFAPLDSADDDRSQSLGPRSVEMAPQRGTSTSGRTTASDLPSTRGADRGASARGGGEAASGGFARVAVAVPSESSAAT